MKREFIIVRLLDGKIDFENGNVSDAPIIAVG
jgi:hypothetical protein